MKTLTALHEFVSEPDVVAKISKALRFGFYSALVSHLARTDEGKIDAEVSDQFLFNLSHIRPR